MKKLLLFTFAFCLLIGFNPFGTAAFAGDDCIPQKPSPPHLVNNLSKEFPDFLSSAEQQMLEDKLVHFNKETSNQIIIIIVDDLCGYDANEFSTRIGQTWGVGQGKFDNGVVVMIKPTGGAGQRDAYIAVGYGLEGVIPDITSKRIVEQELVPYFKNGEYYNALNAATDVIMGLAKKEFAYTDYNKQNTVVVDDSAYWALGLMLIIIILAIVLRKRSGYTSIGGTRTYYGGGWGGSSGWGSGGGGGFGGFGGGGFGGGGAGGKW
jgi:uncharacterized protein